MGPHAASLGMRFYTGNMFPKSFKNHDHRGAPRLLEQDQQVRR